MTQLQLLRQSLAKRWPSAFSVPEVARRVGVTERTYRRWEAGEDHPRRRHLQALGNELGFKPVDERPEALEAAAGLARLQPLMADRLMYTEGDATFQEVAVLVRNMNTGMWLPENVIESSVGRAEAANPAGTYQGDLLKEAATHLRTTAALAAHPEPENRIGTLELALTFQPNSFADVREQLRAVVPGHPDVEATYLDQKAPDRMTLQFTFVATTNQEADEVARAYARQVVVQFGRYGARELSVSVG